MTLTNYTDVERELVKDMLHICGLPYTGHLSRENTHLICKRYASTCEYIPMCMLLSNT